MSETTLATLSTSFWTPFVIGIILTTVMMFASHATGLYRSRGVYAVTLMAIASFYVVFAVEHGSLEEIMLQSALAAGFAIVALIGHRTSLWIVVAGLLAHGLYDLAYASFERNPAPDWWAPLCLGVDVFIAIALAGWITADKSGELK